MPAFPAAPNDLRDPGKAVFFSYLGIVHD